MLRSAVIFCACIVCSAGARGDVTSFITPDRDNTLFEDTTGSISNGSGQWMFGGVTAMGSIRRSLMRFDVAGAIPSGSVVTSVQLRLTLDRGVSSSLFMSLHRVSADWGESTSLAPGQQGAGGTAAPGDATWLHRFAPNPSADPPVEPVFWSNPGGDFEPAPSSLLSVADIGAWTWPTSSRLVADVQSMLDNPSGNFGFLLQGDELAVPPTAKRFFTREASNPTDRPTLIVTYVPSPGAALLALVGGVALVSSRTRRRNLPG